MINGISAYTTNYQISKSTTIRLSEETNAPRFPEDDTVELSQSSQEASPAPIGPGTLNPPDPGNG